MDDKVYRVCQSLGSFGKGGSGDLHLSDDPFIWEFEELEAAQLFYSELDIAGDYALHRGTDPCFDRGREFAYKELEVREAVYGAGEKYLEYAGTLEFDRYGEKDYLADRERIERELG